MNVWILAGGRLVPTPELRRLTAAHADLVIAADGGVAHARTLGVTPHLWVGDFDSSDPHDPRFADVPRHTVPRDKDYTDAELALALARERGAAHVTVLGAFGGRLDHTLALALLAVRVTGEGTPVTLHSGDESAEVLLPGRPLHLTPEVGTALSVLALTDLTGLHLTGVRWPLHDARVPLGSGWTVSNEATEGVVAARLGGGAALVTQLWSGSPRTPPHGS